MRCGLAALFALVLLSTKGARAEPITDSQYTLEYFQGPITASSRVIGLAGAFTALADGCEGEYSNAASPAVRPWYSLSKLDYDICFGFTTAGAFGGTDFENAGPNSGANRFANSATLNVGLQVAYGMFGGTVLVDTFALHVPRENGSTTNVTVGRATTSIAVSFMDGRLLFGFGSRSLIFQGSEHATGSLARDDASLFGVNGSGIQLGAIFMPHRLPLRIGATFRDRIVVDGIQGNPAESTFGGKQIAGGLILPQRLVVPAEIELGVAIELGRRTFNTEWVDPTTHEDSIRERWERKALEREGEYAKILEGTPESQRERKRAELERRNEDLRDEERRAMNAEIDRIEQLRRARSKLLSRNTAMLFVELLYTSPTNPTSTSALTTSITGFAQQQKIAYGDSKVGFFSPRLALETEVIPMWLTVRGGTYMEPSLYDHIVPRVHFTAGFDVRLIRFNPWGLFGEDPWRFRMAFDGAHRYTNFGFSIGKYH